MLVGTGAVEDRDPKTGPKRLKELLSIAFRRRSFSADLSDCDDRGVILTRRPACLRQGRLNDTARTEKRTGTNGTAKVAGSATVQSVCARFIFRLCPYQKR
jgi:hypothetical protein